jgi:imidazolonepropionase-like amidohydrolase
VLLRPAAVFDGQDQHPGWVVLVENDKITAAGPAARVVLPPGARTLDLPGLTLLPGLIEGHSHLLLHPYNETTWNDQVLLESQALRVARATVHAQRTLLAGFTTARDLGTEGAGFADVGLKQAINEGIIPGPRLLAATRALVATGSYGPKLSVDEDVPQGAQEADGVDGIVRAVREQIGKGADVIKVYADYRWGPNGSAQPTFSQAELTLIVQTARSSGRGVVAHASTPEGMRRAILAGVETIEHGDDGTPEIFRLMKQRGVALCPTVAANDAIAQYRGWKKGQDPLPPRLQQKRQSLQAALQAGVALALGGDVGRVCPRRQRPRNGAIGARLRPHAAASAAPGHQRQRPDLPPPRPRQHSSGPAGRLSGRGRRPHAGRCRRAPSAPRNEGRRALQAVAAGPAPAAEVASYG